MKSKWTLVQKAASAKRAGRLDEHMRLMAEIAAFDASCKHKRKTSAECDRGTQTEFGECEPGDLLHLCTSCGKILSRIPADRSSGVRLRA